MATNQADTIVPTEETTNQTADTIVSTELEKWKAKKANLLMPTTLIAGLSEFHKPVIETVYLSSNPDDGDVYPHDDAKPGPQKKWRPTKQALMKLSVCAGVIWSTTESRRIDNGADRNYIAYRAVGGIRKADGQPVFFSADYDLDFEIMEEELRDLYEKKTKADWMKNKTAAEKAEYVDFCVHRDMLQKRKNRLKLCEAGAMNRVLRMLLAIKQAYTTEELSRPFVTMRITFAPDYTDKEVRARLMDASIQAMTGIFGPQAALNHDIRKAQPIDVTPIEDEEPAENGGNSQEGDSASVSVGGAAAPAERSAATAPSQGQAADAPPPPPPPPPNSAVFDFENSDTGDQCKILTTMADRKGYNLQGFLERIKKNGPADMPPQKRVELFEHLLSMPDKAAVAHDGLPF